MGTLRSKTKRAPRCMGTLFEYSRSRMVAQDGFPQIAQSMYFKLFGTLFRQNGKTSLKDMERTATGHRKTKRQSDNCVRYKNGGAPSIGKRNTGA